jgi:hypothetical protein
MGFIPQYFYKYERLAQDEEGGLSSEQYSPPNRRKSWTAAMVLVALAAASLLWIALGGYVPDVRRNEASLIAG